MKMTGCQRLYLATMVVMLVIIVGSLTMKYFESKMLPLLISSVVFVLAGIQFTREILVKEMPISADKTGGGAAKEKWRGYLPNMAWIVGFLLSIYLLGFTISAGPFILGYMKWLGTRWRTTIIFAVLVPFTIYGLVEVALGVELYRGLVLSWAGY